MCNDWCVLAPSPGGHVIGSIVRRENCLHNRERRPPTGFCTSDFLIFSLILKNKILILFSFRQLDLIGQSIYEFCNPLDHNDLSQEISLRPDGELTRSFSLHLKSTTLKDKKITRKSNQKCASYKVWTWFIFSIHSFIKCNFLNFNLTFENK